MAASSLLLLKGFQIVLSFKGHNVLFPNTWFNYILLIKSYDMHVSSKSFVE